MQTRSSIAVFTVVSHNGRKKWLKSTNHNSQTWTFEPIEVNFCFMMRFVKWLTAAANATDTSYFEWFWKAYAVTKHVQLPNNQAGKTIDDCYCINFASPVWWLKWIFLVNSWLIVPFVPVTLKCSGWNMSSHAATQKCACVTTSSTIKL